ncbi:MAG TPA: hypothetical protein VE687_18930, partial [Stellaceae bacterium]|nr:hypothetical protein [Stellaceae bacterium]
MIGSGEAQERGILGETPNLASRLQGLAEPNAVMIAGSTRQLVGELFEYRDLGLFEIKEFHDPIPVWRASRGLTPAEAGTTYYERARRAVEEAE